MQKLSSTAKKIDLVLRILFWVLIVAGVVAVLAALAPLVLRRPAPETNGISLDLDFVKLHLNRPTQEAAMAQQKATLAAMVLMLLGGGIAVYAIKLIRNILKPMIKGQPFQACVSANLKKMGWLILFGGIAFNVVKILMQMALAHGFNLSALLSNDKITLVTFNYSFDATFLLIAAVLFLMSYIFSYGTELQQLSDETL